MTKTAIAGATPPAGAASGSVGLDEANPFQILAAEHELLRHALARTRASFGRRGVSRGPPTMLKDLAESVRRHLQREDRALLPACERLFGGRDGAAAVMRGDHTTIKEDLASLVGSRESAAADSFGPNLDHLERDLERHFVREERVLFPLMAALLRHPEAAAIARVLGDPAGQRGATAAGRSRGGDSSGSFD